MLRWCWTLVLQFHITFMIRFRSSLIYLSMILCMTWSWNFYSDILYLQLKIWRALSIQWIPSQSIFGYLMELWSHREVRSARGKGKGLPQSLRAFARVLSCTTPQELNDLVMEAAQTDGRLARRPFQDINKEIQAHLMLSSFFTPLIEERNAAIMSLNSSNSPSICDRLAVRRLMARDLLVGEIRILKSVSAWLESYCFSLPWWSVHGLQPQDLSHDRRESFTAERLWSAVLQPYSFSNAYMMLKPMWYCKFAIREMYLLSHVM